MGKRHLIMTSKGAWDRRWIKREEINSGKKKDLDYILERQLERKCKLRNQSVEIETSEMVEISRDWSQIDQ